MKLLLILLLSFHVYADCIDCIKNNPFQSLDKKTLSHLKNTIDNSSIINCLDLNRYSCLYKKGETSNNKLIIYHRGHWGDLGGNVPLDLRTRSLNQAINFYELGKSSQELEQTMLISSASIVGFTIKEIESALKKANLKKDSEVILVAHSGGYHGLLKTLNYLKKGFYNFKIKKIVMLDNFYFSKKSTEVIKEYFDQGVACSGFYTQHNEARLESRFLSSIDAETCKIEKRHAHNQSVNQCLVSYVLDKKCL
jgi:hypothetical protein